MQVANEGHLAIMSAEEPLAIARALITNIFGKEKVLKSMILINKSDFYDIAKWFLPLSEKVSGESAIKSMIDNVFSLEFKHSFDVSFSELWDTLVVDLTDALVKFKNSTSKASFEDFMSREYIGEED
jgi:hypothetical protein